MCLHGAGGWVNAAQEAMKRQRKALRVSLKKQEARRRASEDEPEDSPRDSSPYGTPNSTRSVLSNGTFKSSLGREDQVKAFKNGLERVLKEYFESMDLGEAAAQLSNLEEGEAACFTPSTFFALVDVGSNGDIQLLCGSRAHSPRLKSSSACPVGELLPLRLLTLGGAVRSVRRSWQCAGARRCGTW